MGESELRKIPGVDRLLADDRLVSLAETLGTDLTTASVRHTLAQVRTAVQAGGTVPSRDELVARVRRRADAIADPSLKPVLNATGVVLHTNLGRGPLGETALAAIHAIASGYSNLELDLATGTRGSRHAHLSQTLAFLTGAEDALVVNNNAAAVVLALTALASDGEVIVSRGELIEIGGSFRMPEIMRASGAQVVEVGTTNRTRLADYEGACTDATRVLFKAHRSNFYVGGFTEDVGVPALADLAARRGLILVYDIGSGLLNKPATLALEDEPDVRSALADGADLVMFSGDKLMGGPQAGILAGRREIIRRLAAHPLMRALRVGKLTLAALTAVARCHLHSPDRSDAVPILGMLGRCRDELHRLAVALQGALADNDCDCDVVESTGRSGGGTLPDVDVPSYAVRLLPPAGAKRFAERLQRALLSGDRPVLGVVRGKALCLDVLTLSEPDLPLVAEAVHNTLAAGIAP